MTSLSLALGLGLGPRGGFDPVSLFADGSQGFIFDPSDITTLFQDSGGTTPVTAPGQNAVLMRDKSGRGNHATLTNVVYQVDGTGRPYLSFNGTTSSGVTPTITPGTNKAQVFAGVRKLSDAAQGIVLESGAGGAQTISLEAPRAASATFSFASRGSVGVVAVSPATFAAPTTRVLTGIGDIGADNVLIRVNGTLATQLSNDQGTGNYNANPLYLGARSGTSLFFNGRLYASLVRFGSTLSAAEVAQIEAWINSKTGAY